MDFTKLKDVDLVEIGRASDMLWMALGHPTTIHTSKGRQDVTEYAFHIQCPWRFTQKGEIILGSRDIYQPNNRDLEFDSEWEWDIFERDISEQSVYYVRAKDINERLLPIAVRNVIFERGGDLLIEFSKGVNFELFIPGSFQQEYWRFVDFRGDVSSHHIVFDD